MQKTFFAILLSLLVLAAILVPLTTAQTTTGKVIARVLPTNPIADWQTPQKFNVAVDIMKSGQVSLTDVNATGNVIVDIQVQTSIERNGTTTSNNSTVIETTFTLFGSQHVYNGSQASASIQLPQDNNWHNAANLTCYYQPTGTWPKDIVRVTIDYNINIYEEIASSTVDNSSWAGWGMTVTYQGKSVGYSFVQSIIYPATTPSPSPVGSDITVPEIPSISVFALIAAASSLAVVLAVKTKKR